MEDEAQGAEAGSSGTSLGDNPDLITYLVANGVNLLGAILILVVGWLFANWAARLMRTRAEKSPRIDTTLALVISKITRILILAITLIAVLSKFGVETTSFVALIGAAGLTIGLAMQGTLSNVAAGVMLLAFRPFKVGDFVDFEGGMGVVDEIGLFMTRMHAPDNLAMIVPNAKIWGNVLKNFATNPTRRLDMVFGIAYGDDMGRAIGIVREVIATEPRCLKDPEPVVVVGELGDSSVNLWVRPWVNAPDYWAVKWEPTRKIKEAFDQKGISIPFPQRDVHLFQENPPAA
jgi:small conductance mechanosensitive channel